MTRHRRLGPMLCAALSAGILLGFALPAFADERDISVGGVWICRITQDASGYTSYQRAAEVRKRITAVLSNPSFRTRGVAVEVHQTDNTILITVGGMLVFTVTPQDATSAPVAPHVMPIELADQWAARLADGLSRALPDATFHVF